MKLLLDFDGVLITTPSWQTVPMLDDGFMVFNEACAENLATVLAEFPMEIVLTTTHRIHYDNDTWLSLLAYRGITTNHVSKSNKAKAFAELTVRSDEILQWIQNNSNQDYIILDDDKSLLSLPDNIKNRWVQTNFMLGFNAEAMNNMLTLLNQSYKME